MSRLLSSLPVGSLIQDASTMYMGGPIVWKIADKNHSGYPSDSVTLITEKIIATKAFDAAEPNSPVDFRDDYGNNRYIYSNIHAWLNNNSSAWYYGAHSTDAPPSRDNLSAESVAYDKEYGFITFFSTGLKNQLLNTNLTVSKSPSADGGGTETFSGKVFLPSCTEIGVSHEQVCGFKMPIFNSDADRIAYPTSGCVSSSPIKNSYFGTSKPWYYWLRDAIGISDNKNQDIRLRACQNCVVDLDGLKYKGDSHGGGIGIRPMCNVSSSIKVSDSPNGLGVYSVEWNKPPTAPSNIDVPTIVSGDGSLNINWGSSIDTDGNLSGYILERQYNGGAWKQLYKGINRTFVDSITFGWNTVAYRVKACDSAGAESAYQTSATRTVNNNTPPTISGSDGNIGLKTGAFNQSYVVTDVDSGQTITVVERMDGVLKRSYTATNGQSYSFNVNATEWIKLLNGSHTMTITASDNIGGTTTRTYTFTKNETEIELTLATPLPVDDLVTKAIMSVTREIPAGATFTVEVCNNGNDTSPTWENVTNAVLGNSKFFLSNTAKTAAAWGFNFRIKVKRNSATGDSFIVSIGGNFE